MSYYFLTTDGELYHHGIKGMKWGVRRFQNKDGTLTAKGKKRYDDDPNNDDKTNTEQKNKKNKRKGLTDKQKKAIIIGAAAAGTVLAAYGGYKLSQAYKGKGFEIDPESGFRKLKKPEDDLTALNEINPGRMKFLSRKRNVEIINGSSANCMLCTTSYDLRKRGFDVRAGKSTTGYQTEDLFPKIYKNYTETDKISQSGMMSFLDFRKQNPKGTIREFMDHRTDAAKKTVSSLENYVKQQGDGARGNVMVWWEQGGGHSMIWENSGGKVKFMDGQTGQVYKDFSKIVKNAKPDSPIEMLRTDNLELNYSELKKVMNVDTKAKTYVDHGAEIAYKFATNPIVDATAVASVYAGTKTYEAVQDHRAEKERKRGT